MDKFVLRPRLLLFGDSITQQSFKAGGWGSTLADVYQRTGDVQLRGYSGYNTRWCCQILPYVFPPDELEPPALVTVMLGANDANLPPPLKNQPVEASRQHVPIEEYKANLRTILNAIKLCCGTRPLRVLLMTPPPCDHIAWKNFCVSTYGVPEDADPNRRFENTEVYAKACLEVGSQTGTPAVDVHSAFAKRSNWQELFSDGLHPTAAGDAVIAEEVLAAIKKHYPEMQPSSFFDPSPQKLPLDFPDHKAVDVGDVPGCFKRHIEKKSLPREQRSENENL